MTEQWEKYESLDFDQTLLQKAHELANEQLRKQIAEKIRQAGRVDWLKVIADKNQNERLEAMTDAEWETTLAVLNSSQQWEEMWQLAQKAPTLWSKQLLQKLKQTAWLPKIEHEHAGFEKLKLLADKCLGDSPPIGELAHYQGSIEPSFFVYVNKLIFSPDGQILAIFHRDIELWQMPNGQHLATLTGDETYVQKISFSPDGQILVSDHIGEKIKLWQMPDGRLLNTIDGDQPIFIPNEKILATLNYGEIRLWQMPNCQHMATLGEDIDFFVDNMKLSPDGQILAGCDSNGKIKLWQMPNGQHLATFGERDDSWEVDSSINRNNRMLFSPNGQILACFSNDNKIIRLWRTPIGELLATLTNVDTSDISDNVFKRIIFSFDGQILACLSKDGTLKLWQIPNCQLLATLGGNDSSFSIDSMILSPDGQILLGACKANHTYTIRLWQISDGRHLTTLTGDLIKYATTMIFSPDGQILASHGIGPEIGLWRMPDGQPFTPINAHNEYVTVTRASNEVSEINFSPNGQILASRGKKSTIKLWSLLDLVKLCRLPIRKLCQQHEKWIQKTLQDNNINREEKHWLEFMQALMNWHKRFDVEVEDAPQLVSTGEFDIEIEG